MKQLFKNKSQIERIFAFIGPIIVIISCLLPWFTVEYYSDRPPSTFSDISWTEETNFLFISSYPIFPFSDGFFFSFIALLALLSLFLRKELFGMIFGLIITGMGVIDIIQLVTFRCSYCQISIIRVRYGLYLIVLNGAITFISNFFGCMSRSAK